MHGNCNLFLPLRESDWWGAGGCGGGGSGVGVFQLAGMFFHIYSPCRIFFPVQVPGTNIILFVSFFFLYMSVVKSLLYGGFQNTACAWLNANESGYL